MEEHYEFKKKRKTKYEKIVEFALNGMLFSCVNVVRSKAKENSATLKHNHNFYSYELRDV